MLNLNFLRNLIFLNLIIITLIYSYKLKKIFNFFEIYQIIILTILATIIILKINLKKFLNYFLFFLKKINFSLNHNISLLSSIIAILSCTSSLILSKLEIISVFYEKKNFFLLYIILKFIFTTGIIVFILNIGFFIFNCFIKNQYKYSTKIIIFSLIGIIATSLFFSFLGLIEFLNYYLLFLIFFIVILNSKKLINDIIFFPIKIVKNNFFFNIYFLLLIITLIILFIRSNFFFNEDNDVLGHYLNYYNIAKNDEKIFNVSYWSHFTHYKGLGINFFLVTLSDAFSISQVSFIFLLVLLLIIYDFGNRIIKNNFTIGIIVITICSYGISLDNDISAISFSKQHIQFACLYTFIIWLSWNLFINKNNKNFYLLLLTTLFFTGFSHHLFSFIILIKLNILIIFFYFFNIRNVKYVFFSITLLSSGIFLSLLINYLKTGIPEFIFTNITWQFSDQKKFIDLIGYKNLLFPTLSNTDYLAIQKNNFENFSYFFFNIKNILFSYVLSIFRSYYSLFLLLIIFIFFTIKNEKLIIKLNLFIFVSFFSTFLVYFFFKNPAFTRGIFFINHFFILFFLINVCFFLRFCSLKFNKIFQFMFIIPVIFFCAFFVEKNLRKNSEFYKTILYGNSIKDTLSKCLPRQVDCQNFNFVTKINSKYNVKKLYALNSFGGMVSFLPRPGLIIEPFFNESKKINNFMYVKNEDIFNEFYLLNTNFFIFNSRSQSYNTFITPEFSRNYLQVLETSNNEVFLLKLQKDFIPNKMDKYFQNIYDLKKSYLINYIFSKEFENEVNNLNKNNIIENITTKSTCLNETNQNILLRAISKSESITPPPLPTSKSTNSILDQFRYLILKEVAKFYNIDYNEHENLDSLSTLGSLTIKPNNLNYFYINNNHKIECKFFKNEISNINKILK